MTITTKDLPTAAGQQVVFKSPCEGYFKVSKLSGNRGFYFDFDRYDHVQPNATAAVAKLNEWNADVIGYESDDE